MKKTDSLPSALPLEAQGILELAARSMFHLFSSISQGMFLVDRTGRIVWVNEGYKRFLPALGFSSVDQFVGHTVEGVIPNTQMRRVLETGEPFLIDLLTNQAGTFVVSRIPLRDERDDRVIGAIGIVLFDHPETTLQPLISKFALLQRDLDDARRELASQRLGQRQSKYTFASFVGTSPAAVEVKRQARHAKLLRVLQEGEIEPLGSNRLQSFDARLIAATSRDLAALVREGRFREDLYYRLNVLPIRVPPLRERRSDIPALVEVLGEDMALRSGGVQPELSAEGLALLSAQTWRGNIRELRNV